VGSGEHDLPLRDESFPFAAAAKKTAGLFSFDGLKIPAMMTNLSPANAAEGLSKSRGWLIAGGTLVVLLIVSLQAVVRFVARGHTHPAFRGVAAGLRYPTHP
jgi:hypothetical protein